MLMLVLVAALATASPSNMPSNTSPAPVVASATTTSAPIIAQTARRSRSHQNVGVMQPGGSPSEAEVLDEQARLRRPPRRG